MKNFEKQFHPFLEKMTAEKLRGYAGIPGYSKTPVFQHQQPVDTFTGITADHGTKKRGHAFAPDLEPEDRGPP
jgi:hypothetical protein